jgi:hypothetical protein
MVRWQYGAAASLLFVAVSGCSVTPPPSLRPAAAKVSASFDGNYNGTTQLIRGSNIACGSQDPMTLHVVNNGFSYTLNQPQVVWQPVRSFEVIIAPDGSFQSQSGPASIRGRVGGGHMQGEINGDACGFLFEADSSGTW